MVNRKTIIDTYFEMHEVEHKTNYLPEECPICDILLKETNDAFKTYLTDKLSPCITEMMTQWDKLAFPIANNTNHNILIESIIDSIIQHPISTKALDIEIYPEDIKDHPYVIQKIKEFNNK
jgi:hypothetical protein